MAVNQITLDAHNGKKRTPITLTLSDLEHYLKAISRPGATRHPYGQKVHGQTYQLSQPQLAHAMRALGYSQTHVATDLARSAGPSGAATHYPLSIAQLKEFVTGIAKQGQSFRSQFPLLQQSGYKSVSQVQSQLEANGYSSAQAHKIINSQGSALDRLLSGIDVLPIPIPAGAAGAAGAAAGGADAAGAGAAGAGAAESGAAAGAGGGAAGSAAAKAAAGAGKKLAKDAGTGAAIAAVYSDFKGSAKYAGIWIGLLLLGLILILMGLNKAGVPKPTLPPVFRR